MSDAHSRRIFRSTHADPTEVNAEFEFHLSMRARELEAQGHAPARARELAVAEFGDLDEAGRFCRAQDAARVREYRRAQWIENVMQDLRFALRTMRRRPAAALSSLLTLGVAIALAVAAYGVVHAYLVRPLPYPEPDRLVRIRLGPTREPFPNPPSLERVDWRVADSVFAAAVRWNPDAFTVSGTDRTVSVEGAWVSAEYFTVLGLRPGAGRVFAPDEHAADAPVVIISDALWNGLFARDSSVLGRAIRVQSLESPGEAELATVVGIMSPNAWHVDRFTDLLRPLPPSSWLPLMARLQPGMSNTEAAERLNALVLPQLGAVDPAFRLSLGNVQEEYTYRLRPTLVALLAGALFLLLIAGANVASAQAARAASRRSELHVRLALGASRARVTLQLLVESGVVAVLAGVIGAVLAALALAALAPIVSTQLGLAIPGGTERLALDIGVLVLVVTVGAVMAGAFGMFPAVVVARAVASPGLVAGGLGERGTARPVASAVLRRSLIVAQVAFTMMLLVGAGLMARTVLTIASTPLGFDDAHVIKGDLFLPPTRYSDDAAYRAAVAALVDAVAAEPAVSHVAASFPDPLRTFILPPIAVNSDAGHARGDAGQPAASHVVTPAYFEVLNMPLQAGRAFSARDTDRGQPVAIISEELAQRLWPAESAVGRRIRATNDSVWRTVIGVVGETRQPVETAQTGELYLPYAQSPIPMFSMLARVSRDTAGMGAVLQRAVTRVDDGLGLMAPKPLSDLTVRATRRHHALAGALSIFGALALALAMVGLYATLTYVVAQRRREIGIRVALGADAWAIRRLVAREGIFLVAGGVSLGIALSFSLTRLLQSQLFGVTPTDPGTFASIVLLLAAASLVASLAPFHQASRVDPAGIMRAD